MRNVVGQLDPSCCPEHVVPVPTGHAELLPLLGRTVHQTLPRTLPSRPRAESGSNACFLHYLIVNMQLSNLACPVVDPLRRTTLILFLLACHHCWRAMRPDRHPFQPGFWPYSRNRIPAISIILLQTYHVFIYRSCLRVLRFSDSRPKSLASDYSVVKSLMRSAILDH